MSETVAHRARLCRGCVPGGLCLLGVDRLALAAEGVVARAVCSTMEGNAGVAHGGWTAAVFDEVLGMLTELSGVPTVTLHLEVDYRRPVPIHEQVEISGRCVRREGRKWFIAGEVTRAGELLAQATALMLEPRTS